MNPMKWFRDRFQSPGSRFAYEPIDPARVDGGIPPRGPVRSGEQYFRVVLVEMFLRNDRNWFTDYAPAVYSLVTLRFGDREETVSHVAGPTPLNDLKKASSENRSVTLNYPLTPLLPFNGGDVEMELGLVALPGSNDIKRLLNVLTSFSKALAVPQLSLAVGFAQPLVAGITELVGSEDTKLVLRLHDMCGQGGKPLQPGYRAVVAARLETFKAADLYVKNDRLFSVTDLPRERQIEQYSYMLLRVDVVDERDDYQSLSSIAEPYQSAIASLDAAAREADPQKQEEKVREAERFLGAAKVAAFKAKELTIRTGRRQVIEALQKAFDEAKELLAPGTVDPAVARTLQEAMTGAISVDEARLKGAVAARDL